MQSEREQAFRRNERLEALLQEMNEILEPAEDRILENYHMPRYPVIFIVGCARSGSTLMLQWLASTGYFAYPTNLLSRFYAAPYIGARIQQLLADPQYRFKDEFDDCTTALPFSSDLGKTKGTLAPNEFWYFWRRFFHYGEIQQLSEDALESVDGAKFVAELAALEAVFDKPFILKALIINWNIPFIARLFDKVLFLHITRQPVHNAQSLLESREKYFGTIDEWYSFKPPEFVQLKNCGPYEQVAGQVYATNEAISKGLDQINRDRWMKVSYEEFCQHPATVFSTIKEKFIKQDFPVDWHYTGPEAFECKNQIRLAEEKVQQIMNAYTTCAQENR
jgi:hypothetical protein